MASRIGRAFVIASCWLSVAGMESASGTTQWYVGYGRMAVSEELSKVCAGICNSMECARAIERYQMARPGARFERSGDTLRIALQDGRTVSLRDDWSYTQRGNAYRRKAYSYVEFIPQMRQRLVHVQYYEGFHFYLLDSNLGKETEICGVPIASPKARRFACYEADLESGSSVEVWRIMGTDVQREWVFEHTDWVPVGLVWLSENSIRISREDFEGRQAGNAIVTRKSSVWGWADQVKNPPGN